MESSPPDNEEKLLMNLDEALRCCDLAALCMSKEEWERASRLLKKSLRMARTERAVKLSEELEVKLKRGNREEPSTTTAKAEEVKVEERKQEKVKEESKREVTEEQLRVVQGIIKLKEGSLYEVLGVKREATAVEIKSAYRKLVLQVHPDKNNAPGSEVAFKIIREAFTILSDQQQRQRYDRTGHTTRRRTSPRTRPNPANRRSPNSDSTDEDEFFTKFNRTSPPPNNQPALYSFFTLAFLLGLFCWGLKLFLLTPPTPTTTPPSFPTFTFPHHNVYHPHAYQTQFRKVPYLAKATAMKEYRNRVNARKFRKFERKVEKAYTVWLEERCTQERKDWDRAQYRDQWFGRWFVYLKPTTPYHPNLSSHLPYCHTLHTL